MGFSPPPAPIITPPWVPGRTYDGGMSLICYVGHGQAVPAGVLYATPVYRPRGGLVTQIGIDVLTAGAAGTKARFGFARYGAGSALPGALILDAGEVATDAVGAQLINRSMMMPPVPIFSLCLFSGTPTVLCYNPDVAVIAPYGYSGIAKSALTESPPAGLQATLSYGPFPLDLSVLTWVMASPTDPPVLRLVAG